MAQRVGTLKIEDGAYYIHDGVYDYPLLVVQPDLDEGGEYSFELNANRFAIQLQKVLRGIETQHSSGIER